MSVADTVHPLLLDPDYSSLKQHLIESTGLAYYADKDSDLASRLGTRITQLTLNGCGAYLDLLKNEDAGSSERQLLIGQLTIGETYFFRHSEQFDAVRDVALPDIIDRNQTSRTLRIWSAGCAIGAEPYSVAILLQQHFADRLAGWDVRIMGTDINQAFLERARRGEFDERALRMTPDHVKYEWFTPVGGAWTIKPFAKHWMSFQYHNLVEHPYPSIANGLASLDLILCRNVMIYFDWEVIGGILGRFHECLAKGGWLAVGHAESNPEAFTAYRAINVPGATLYQKNGDGAVRTSQSPNACISLAQAMPAVEQPWSPPALPSIPDPTPSALQARSRTPVASALAEVRRLADEGQLDAAARSCAVLIGQERLDPIAHFYHGVILEQLGRQEEAERALRRALYLDRHFVLAHYHLALLLSKTGRRDSGMQSLRNAQALLSGMEKTQEIAQGDGLTAADLQQLTDMHLDIWRK